MVAIRPGGLRRNHATGIPRRTAKHWKGLARLIEPLDAASPRRLGMGPFGCDRQLLPRLGDKVILEVRSHVHIVCRQSVLMGEGQI